MSDIVIPLQGVLGFYPTIDEGTNLKYDLITPGILINDVPLILGDGAQSDIQAVTDSTVLLLPFEDVKELMDSCCSFSKMINFSLAKKQRFCLTLFRLRGEKKYRFEDSFGDGSNQCSDLRWVYPIKYSYSCFIT